MLGRIDLGEFREPKPTAKIYGIKRLLTTSDPAWKRTDDAIGLYAEATHDGSQVRNDFDDLYPWSAIYTYSWDKNTGTETRYDEPGFNYTDNYVMTKIPEFWHKRWQDGEYEYIQIADNEVDGFTKSEEFSLGRYTMSGSSSAVYSRSGYKPFTNTNITNFRNYAKNLGTGWGQLDWHYFLLQMLYLVEYADYNSQNTLGQGNTNNSSSINSGGCNDLGMKSGCITDKGSNSVIYRGVEDIFGNIYQFLDGLNIKDYIAYICYDPAKYASDVFTGDYKAVGYTNTSSDNSYIKTLGYDSKNPLVALPTSTGGSSSTYIPDCYRCNSDNRIARVGGCYSSNADAGLWYWGCSFTSVGMNSNNGARLLKYQ